MLFEFKKYLKTNCQVLTSDLLIVGVSGGPDSLCLFHLLKSIGQRMIVGHLNHALRKEAESEALRVERLSRDWGVPCEIAVQDVSVFAKSCKMSIEEAAREVRYRFLFNLAEKHGAKAVCVGHTADDQVETILMHFLRGSGLSGLRGMLPISLPNCWSSDIPLIRPLLTFWRDDILQYCQKNHLEPVFDESNLDTSYFRNRLRYELIPLLAQNYNVGIKKLLWQMGAIIAEDFKVLDELVSVALQASLLEEQANCLMIDRKQWEKQPLALKRGMLRRVISRLRPLERDINFDTVERGIDFLNNGEEEHRTGLQKMHLINSLAIWRGDDYFIVYSQDKTDVEIGLSTTASLPVLSSTTSIILPLPGRVTFFCKTNPSDCRLELWEISAEWVNTSLELDVRLTTNNNDPYQAWLDLESFAAGQVAQLEIRSRKRGDKIAPLGMGGHTVKISDWMINQKIPLGSRDSWPLLCLCDTIIWVPGFRIAQSVGVKPNSKQILHLTCQRAWKRTNWR